MAQAVTEFEWTPEEFAKDAESQYEKVVKVDNGTYEAVVCDSEVGTAKKSGNPIWIVEFKIRGGKFAGEKLKKWVPLTGKGVGIARQTFSAFHDISELTGKFKPDWEGYLGKKCIIVTKQRPYTNEYGDQIGVDVERVLKADDAEAQAAVEATVNEQETKTE